MSNVPMRIDGKAIADTILADLSLQTAARASEGVRPTLAVIQVGDDAGSSAYIRQKQKAADRTGIRLIHDHLPATVTDVRLLDAIRIYETDKTVHGLIIQRPLPEHLGDLTAVTSTMNPTKDVDGFLPGSPFSVPVAAAVGEILQSVHSELFLSAKAERAPDFIEWLRMHHIAVIGRGSTAGAPIARYFEALHCTTSVIHSQTPDPESVLRDADVVISCVGKPRTVTGDMLKPDAILIGVGLSRGSDGKLRGDYDEPEISSLASFYTPTPGGVGPVNVACLMQNVVKACTISVEGELIHE